MKVLVRSLLAVLLLTSCATSDVASTPIASAPSVSAPTDILGIRLGMPRDTVRTTLASAGKMEREERRRHEVWTVDDPRFASLIIGYDPDWTVRFVTGVARPTGTVVRYADVLDLAAAQHRSAGASHTYTWAVGEPRYYVIAIGGEERVEYLSIKKDNQPN
ncbi:MAG TPA: hypothetical protein VGF48_02775 [Thermoanaerobaculia bacterium]